MHTGRTSKALRKQEPHVKCSFHAFSMWLGSILLEAILEKAMILLVRRPWAVYLLKVFIYHSGQLRAVKTMKSCKFRFGPSH